VFHSTKAQSTRIFINEKVGTLWVNYGGELPRITCTTPFKKLSEKLSILRVFPHPELCDKVAAFHWLDQCNL